MNFVPFPVDFSWEETLAIGVTQELTDTLNSDAFCGITNWAPEVRFDISDCEFEGTGPFPRLSFDVYLVNGDDLFFSSDGPAGTVEERPDSASLIVSFTRQ